MYTPHSSSNSASSTASTTYRPSTSGPTVYTPHSSSASSSTNGSVPTVYTPHSASGAGSSAVSHSAFVAAASSASSLEGTKSSLVGHAAYTLPPASIASKTSNGASVLTHVASEKVVSQLNTSRVSLSGVNKRPLPRGLVTVQASGRLTLAASAGRQYSLRPNGTLASFSGPRSLSANFATNGQLRSVQTAKMKIQYGASGGRTVTKQLSNSSTLVGFGPHSGYLQQTILRNNATWVQRTYVAQNSTFVRMYSPYSYRGVGLMAYTPGVYYAPAFYGWAYYPWNASVAYAWGWSGDPWFAYYGSYFAPLPAYASSTLWMTDYILGSTLAAAYQQQQDFSTPVNAGAAGDEAPADDGSQNEVQAETSTPITPELRTEIAEEVRQELATENAVASNKAPADVEQLSSDLQPNHVFVVASLLNVASDQGNCSLTGGDIITLVDQTGSDSQSAVLGVASSKRGDCPAGAKVQVSLQDLQDMDNNLRAQMDSALVKLHSSQGREGLPAAPKSAIGPPPRPVMGDGDNMPAAEQDVPSMLAEEEQNASKEEKDVIQEAFASNPSGQ